MRVTCYTLEEFIENLSEESSLFQKSVFVSVSSQVVSEVTSKVLFQASAVVDLEDGGQYLIQVGEYCGFDRKDASQEKGGSIEAKHKRMRLSEWCKSRGLKVRPGVVDY